LAGRNQGDETGFVGGQLRKVCSLGIRAVKFQFWIEPEDFAKTQYLIEGDRGEYVGFYQAILFTQ